MSAGRVEELDVRPTSDVAAVHALLTECGLDLRDRFGLSHWVPAYPLHLLREAAGRGEVYEVGPAGGPLVATFSIGREPPPYYGGVAWAPEGEPGVYVARVAVRPSAQQAGLGSRCMRWIEGEARARGARSVRLDAYARHPEALRFYRRLGYADRGTAIANDRPLICFEKVLLAAE
ncbi:MAG: GNAT family N-acetyltransferase [Actinomycetota bacterium]|nr:GNAT family N-acetyltransferase [Actinomycetota bacterium]